MQDGVLQEDPEVVRVRAEEEAAREEAARVRAKEKAAQEAAALAHAQEDAKWREHPHTQLSMIVDDLQAPHIDLHDRIGVIQRNTLALARFLRQQIGEAPPKPGEKRSEQHARLADPPLQKETWNEKRHLEGWTEEQQPESVRREYEASYHDEGG
jgi:ATPase subunit of ABC transporter with duplicated ATPase domains